MEPTEGDLTKFSSAYETMCKLRMPQLRNFVYSPRITSNYVSFGTDLSTYPRTFPWDLTAGCKHPEQSREYRLRHDCQLETCHSSTFSTPQRWKKMSLSDSDSAGLHAHSHCVLTGIHKRTTCTYIYIYIYLSITPGHYSNSPSWRVKCRPQKSGRFY